MLEDGTGGYFSYGLMLNYSSGGMCIGSDAINNNGTSVKIRFSDLFTKLPLKFIQVLLNGAKS